ncbi:helix-turn-helix domain-containing protein [Thermodesulfobacteriota bacterium]
MDRDKLVEAWKKYGATYNVFVPDEQPTPKGDGWDRPMPEPSDTGTIDPQLMKHWRFFTATRNFLRHQYAEHGILQSPALTFDCLVPKYQKPLKASQAKKGKRKKKSDPEEWYAGAVRMLMTDDGEVGFTCRSRECLRTQCKLNLQNPKRMSPVDIFSLIQIFYGYRSVAKAKQIVAEAFEVQIGKFEFRDVEKKPLIKHYAIPKWAIQELIESFSGMRRQEIPRLVEEAVQLVKTSQLVELEHNRVFSHYFAFFWPQLLDNDILQKINGAAIRLYLWLLVEQEERARRNEFAMRLTDAEIARALGASKQTIGRYRQELEKLGLIKIKGDIWTAGYTVKSQWNS